jgi:hypothetical protein
MTELERIFAELTQELGLEPPYLFRPVPVWRRGLAERCARPPEGQAIASRRRTEGAERNGG